MLPLARAFFVYFFLVESYFALFCNELYQMKLNFFLLKLFEKKKKNVSVLDSNLDHQSRNNF